MTEPARQGLSVSRGLGVIGLAAALIVSACGGGGDARVDGGSTNGTGEVEQSRDPEAPGVAEAEVLEAGGARDIAAASAGGGAASERLAVLAQGPELGGLEEATLVDPPILSLVVGDRQGADGGPAAGAVSFASGTTRLVYEMIFDAMQDGLSWEDRWFHNGLAVEGLGGPRPVWAAGTRGRLVSGIENVSGFPDGLYELEILVRGSVLARRAVTIGATPLPQPVLSNPRWQADAAALDEAGTRFPEGIRELVLHFDRRDAGAVQEWTVIWRRDGEEILRLGPEPWLVNRDAADLALTHPVGLPAGGYSVELYFDGELTASFTGVQVGELPPAIVNSDMGG